MISARTNTHSCTHGGKMNKVTIIPTRQTPISVRVALASYPVDDEVFEELWDKCYELDWVPVGEPQMEDRRTFCKLNVREIYRMHKAAGYPQHFSRFLLDALESAEDCEDFDPAEEGQLCDTGNWFKKNGVLLFRQIGPWTYDEYCDDYYPPHGPLVRGSISYF